uniref:Neur_chan_memb domain-containing protein n=1 Tax=Caenorhabditis tropicalis TaxID=1561998 RepID=A0A1I7UVM5_9PELO
MLLFVFLDLLNLVFSNEIHELRSECLNEAQLMDTLINKRDYSKHKLPKKTGITVSVEFWIQEINSISEMTNDFELELFINEMWTDPNLRLWTPNTCFVNSKFAEIYESPFQNVFLTLFDNGTVWVNYEYPAGNWDELVVTFVFERRYMWYFLQAYLPTFFSIFISWIAFSLGPQAITPRTMIGVNALLSMIFHFGSIMKNLPRVSYIKAIDVWMLSSMTFVFLSLIELAIVGYKLQMQREKDHVIEKVDRIARFAFPAGFSIFNIIYWARYGFKVG